MRLTWLIFAIAFSAPAAGQRFGPQQVIATATLERHSVHATDIDGDGDADVFCASLLTDKIAWHENIIPQDCNGNGFPDAKEISYGLATDCDNDGTLDDCQLSADPTFDLNKNGVFSPCEALGKSDGRRTKTGLTRVSPSITALGSVGLFLDDVTLTARALPSNTIGLFVASRSHAMSSLFPISQRANHLPGSVRPSQITQSGTRGSIALPIHLISNATPTCYTRALIGETWSFQAWFRDSDTSSAATSFTDTVSLIFQ